jgi:hypothetical protein
MDRVFVSYRRSDAEFLAAELQARLIEELDAEVFFDLQSILPGDDWEAEITAALKHCSVFVLLLGRDWVGTLPSGKRRIDEDDDVFRLEMERALDSTIAIIPVLLGDVSVPKVSELPEGLRRLADLQAITIDSKQMESTISSLIAAIRRGLDRAHDPHQGDEVNLGYGLEPRRTILNWSIDSSALSTEALPSLGTTSTSTQLRLAVDSALVTVRPLLLVGATGKVRREIGRDIAYRLGWRYYEYNCTERTTSQDLVYAFDQTRRLADAQVRGVIESSNYVEPGVLWWAFDADSARRRGASPEQMPTLAANDPSSVSQDPQGRAVVAIHGLDRLEQFVTEQLFVLIDNQSFVVTELGAVIRALGQGPPQIILGVERTRAVPKWVRQRCALGRLQEPSINELASSTKLRIGEENSTLVDQVTEALTADLTIGTHFASIDAATFEDIVKTVLELDIPPGGTTWRMLLDTFGIE